MNEKRNLQENCENAYFSRFFTKFNKPCVNFLRVCTKNANCLEILRKFWNFLMKILSKNSIYFFLLFRKFVTKNRAFGNNTIFLRQFFRFRGGIPPFPFATPLHMGASCMSNQKILCLSCRIESVTQSRQNRCTIF